MDEYWHVHTHTRTLASRVASKSLKISVWVFLAGAFGFASPPAVGWEGHNRSRVNIRIRVGGGPRRERLCNQSYVPEAGLLNRRLTAAVGAATAPAGRTPHEAVAVAARAITPRSILFLQEEEVTG